MSVLIGEELISVRLPPPLPTVVHLQRKNGVVVQDCDVYIGRACFRGGWELKQSIWHNPFTIKNLGGNPCTIEDVLQAYKKHLLVKPDLMANLSELSGKRLGCWCKPGPCHGDVLVEVFDEYFK